MKEFDKLFSTKDGISYVLKNRNIYRFSQLKIRVLIRLHLSDVKESKLVERKNIFRQFRNDLGNYLPSAITTNFLSEWLECLRADMNYSEKTMTHIKCQLNHFFKWLLKQEAIDKNPLIDIKYRQSLPPMKPRRFFKSEQVEKILDVSASVSAPSFHTFLYALIHTGARRSELLKLDWKDVDLPNLQFTFRQTKNGSDRTIFIPFTLAQEITKNSDSRVGPVFLNEKGYILSRQKIQKGFDKLKEEMPDFGSNWSCHSMRHSFAHNFLRNGGEMYQLKAILGHKSIKMTVDLYGNLKSQDIENPSPYNF